MRFYLTVVFFLLHVVSCTTSNAQSSSTEEKLNEGSLSALNDFLRSSSKRSNCDGDLYGRTHWAFYREIVPSHFEAAFLVVDCNDSASQVSLKHRYVKLLFKDSTIYYYAFYNPYDEFIGDISSKTLSAALYNELLARYEQVYGIALDAQELFLGGMFSTYGCGIGGEELEQFKVLQRMVSNNDIRRLNKWLRSPNIIDQLYALYGFNIMERKGYSIDQPTRRIVAYVKKKEGVVKTCSGCTVEDMSIDQAIKEFIPD